MQLQIEYLSGGVTENRLFFTEIKCNACKINNELFLKNSRFSTSRVRVILDEH